MLSPTHGLDKVVTKMTRTKTQKARAKEAKQAMLAPKTQVGKRQPKKKRMQQLYQAPAAFGNAGMVPGKPIERVGRNGSRSIRFKEFVQDISGSVGFGVSSFAVQPGVATLFAWLSGQAGYYQEYRVKRLRFCFDTEKSSATSGKVMFAFSPDAADSAPVNKQEMLEYGQKAKGVPWVPFEFEVDTSTEAFGRSRYIRTGGLAANLDIKMYDIGILFVATQGMADTTAVGELYVEYDIELMVPVVSTAALAKAVSLQIAGVSPSQTSVFGTAPTYAGGLDVTGTVNTLTFNRVGTYIIAMNIGGTGLATSMVPVVSSSTATVTRQFGVSNAAANAGTNANYVALIVVSQRGQTAVFDYSTMSTTITSSASYIAPYNVV